ncbi:VWA domain-containing protein [Haloplanus sp.]|uniref:VWA domain-containing protein n=1 Tax=Haloplanus sp. TaxID=1961696 RepID=UPI00261C5287|nr:VWA domain-containing protein [Haloplanus sp.]
MRLTASTALQSVRERLGVGDAETLRESEKRRRHLQKYVRLLSTSRPRVRFSTDIRTATTDHDGDRPEITVTTRAFDQPATEFRRRAFDLAVQEALVVHEMGHLRYTDIDGFHDLLATVDPERRRMFSRIWNTLEDGAVERQLRRRYAVATELEVLNANLFEPGPFGREMTDGDDRRFSFFHAVVCGLADMAIYDSGRFRALQDDATGLRMASLRDRRVLETVVPTMHEAVAEVVTEPDPTARNKRILTFWRSLVEAMDGSTVSGTGASELADLVDADGTVRVGQTGRQPAGRRVTDAATLPETGAGAPLPGKPDDTAGGFGQHVQPARDLARESVRREVGRQITSATGSDADGTDDHERTATPADTEDSGGGGAGTSPGEGTPADGFDAATTDDWLDAQSHPGAGRLPGQSRAGVAGDTESDGNPDPDPTPTETDAGSEGGELATAFRERYNEELATEVTELEEAQARLDALEAYVRALDAAGAEGLGLDVVTAADNDGDTERWRTVQRDGTSLARRFRNRLREQQRDVEHRRQRRGTLDRSRLVAASRGHPDVFTRVQEGEDKRYTCVVVLDRSGSMDGGAVDAAETGALTAAFALESVGVEVTILDLHDSTVRLVKTGTEGVRETRNRVLTGRAGGGTPLSDALSLARARFIDAENPFVLVVTDGLPDDEAAYTAELDTVSFPVLGVYLTRPEGTDTRPVESDRTYFHRLAVVTDWSTVDQRLRRLAARVLF